ncbi:hypothetical protein J6590_091949 [Homalodisca vitripennis]|nr:hypothetical protein J6590_091949 [Homalodisca vitripennis]
MRSAARAEYRTSQSEETVKTMEGSLQDSQVLKVRNREIVVHVNRVKPYVSRTKVNQVPEVHVDDDVGDIEIPDSNICIGEGTPSADDGIPVPSVGTPRTGNRLPRVKKRPARLEDYVP